MITTAEPKVDGQPSSDQVDWLKRTAYVYHALVRLLKLKYNSTDQSSNSHSDVFVSHTGANKESYVVPLVNYLREHTARKVFIDKRIPVRSYGDVEMMRAAITCNIFWWCVLSDFFVTQWYPLRELQIAYARHIQEDPKNVCLVLVCLEQGATPKGTWMKRVLKKSSLYLYDERKRRHNFPGGMQVASSLESFDDRIVRISSTEFSNGEIVTHKADMSGADRDIVVVDMLKRIAEDLGQMKEDFRKSQACPPRNKPVSVWLSDSMIDRAFHELIWPMRNTDCSCVYLPPSVVSFLTRAEHESEMSIPELHDPTSSCFLLPLNVLNMHWVLLRISRPHPNEAWNAMLYDSLASPSQECWNDAQRTLRVFERRACHGRGGRESHITLEVAKVPLSQCNGADCGIFCC